MLKLKNLSFDVSRQLTTDTAAELAETVLENNRNLFFENYSSSCLIIDNWTSHGTNFIRIIAQIFDETTISEHLVDFKVANVQGTF